MDFKEYEWLDLHAKGANGRPHLNAYLKNETTCYLDVYTVKASKNYSNNVAVYILSGITK